MSFCSVIGYEFVPYIHIKTGIFLVLLAGTVMLRFKHSNSCSVSGAYCPKCLGICIKSRTSTGICGHLGLSKSESALASSGSFSAEQAAYPNDIDRVVLLVSRLSSTGAANRSAILAYLMPRKWATDLSNLESRTPVVFEAWCLNNSGSMFDMSSI